MIWAFAGWTLVSSYLRFPGWTMTTASVGRFGETGGDASDELQMEGVVYEKDGLLYPL